ncbi:PREDICTED: piggyBac transposable element-derived protein 4-like isoform X1 [Poecilia mexicana]|uniref:piggyBac transposable element-derived protein 4-like isoform X1 n=1 Tax=Poecilia mexicana TaxID=48701 RepID=UPI00072E62C3|nr:PREDICTED: piggyBac transposable element-derived protein 4-like isoform X1 [Poecilia mexicana]
MEEKMEDHRRLLDFTRRPKIILHRIELEEISLKMEDHRTLLDFSRIPKIILHRIDLCHCCMCKEDGVLNELSNKEGNSTLKQEEPEPLQIKQEPEPLQIKQEQEEPEHQQFKEEEKQLSISQDEEHLVLKQETDDILITSSAMAQQKKMSDVEALEEIFKSDSELKDSSDSCWDSEEEEDLDKAERIDLGDVQVEAEPSSSHRTQPPTTPDETSSSLSDDGAAVDEEYVPPVHQPSAWRGRAPATKRKTTMLKAARKRQKASTLEQHHQGQDVWHTAEEPDMEPECPRFSPSKTPGPQIDATRTWSPLNLFKLFFSATTIQQIINNTNKNAERLVSAGKNFKWSPLTEKDFYTFLAIIIFSGLVNVPSKPDLWRTKWPYNFPFPRSSMARDRFEAISWSLHLSDIKEDEDNEKKRGTPGYDRLLKVRPLYDQIRVACKSAFQPSKEICIDERMVASKAQITFKEFMKDKPTRFGYKLYALADSRTGYTWNFFIYQGKSAIVREEDLSTKSVMDLLDFPLLGKGYHLYVDNFYTSPYLFQKLVSNHTAACGTIRQNRVGFPKTTENNLPKNALRGEMRWMRKDGLLFVRWKDTKELTICSTFHRAFSGQTVQRRVKEAGQWVLKDITVPDSVKDYNQFMGGVDLSNALLQDYSVRNKTMKWYKTFFYHFIDISVVNSFILFKMLAIKRGEIPISQRHFREKLMEELIQAPKAAAASAQPRAFPECSIPRFFGGTADKRRTCVWCKKNGSVKKTPLYCPKCEVALCLLPGRNCFEDYHKNL